MDYGIRRKLDMGFDEARARIEEELKKEGFGVLTEIDVKATLKKKLDVNYRRYNILGACNPAFAHKALELEREVGLLLPCNVIVYEDDDGKTVVSAMNVEMAIASLVPNLKPLADAVGAKLQAALDRL
ncbi:MAG TPA: DUF302 domain-containing protein [Acidobacteriota bacterium]|nr:DUF302 domain-containing protein [Acidobacteriota bacterium]